MLLSLLRQVAFSALLVSALTPTPTKRTISGPLPPSQFVTTKNDQFFFNGHPLAFVGTNAYWLPALNSEADIDATLASIANAGISLVRTWAFNDVLTVPVNGTWFQLISNGITSINNGTNGLQKLDTVVRLAEKHGLFLQLALTNNWNPFFNATTARNNNTPGRNVLSNDYGGMDTYLQGFSNSPSIFHSEFYTNQTILNAFLNYTTQIVTRYVNSPAVFGWEIANDPRCNSSVPASPGCNTNTITLFLSQVATHITSIDPNHLVTSGNNGFFCMDCPKLFPRVPAPATSASVGRRSVKPLTKVRLLQERKAAWKEYMKTQERSSGGPSIRGKWLAPEAKRQFDQGVGPAFDGSSGVDTEDIMNIPQMGYGSFQLFPDQNNYGPGNPNLPAFNNTVQLGLSWIQNHADLGPLFNKPVTLTGFGLVTQNNAPNFVPFNTTVAPFGPDPPSTTTSTAAAQATQAFGVSDSQRNDAYAQWLQAGLQAGVGSLNQYQWSQENLTVGEGTAVQPIVSGTAESPVVTGTGLSPIDGYGIQGDGQAQVVGTLQTAGQASGTDATL